MSNMEAIKRIILYVKGFVGRGILFPAADTSIKYNFLSFIDSNWCGDKDDQKSIDGYLFMYGVTPISWCSEKESVVAFSYCEAEYIATSLCVCQAA